MQVTDELRPMFSYSLITILFFLILVLVNIYLLLRKPKKESEDDVPVIIAPLKSELSSIKEKYLKEIDLLAASLNEGKITSRKAYQRLSGIIRRFIYEVTKIKVQNYSLDEIKRLHIPILTELVSEYYAPEFARESKGNISLSLDKTKGVVERWR